MAQSGDELSKQWVAAMEAVQDAEYKLKVAVEAAIEAKIKEVMAEFEVSCERDGTRSSSAVKEVHAKIQLLRHNQHFSSQFVNAPLDVSKRKRLLGF